MSFHLGIGLHLNGLEAARVAADPVRYQLTDPALRNHAPLAAQPNEFIDYAVVEPRDAQIGRTVLLVPGFSEGITAKVPLAAALAERGHRVIVPHQNRRALLRDEATGELCATYSRAEHLLSVVRNEGLDTEPGSVDVVAKSYGGLIFSAAVKLAQQRGIRTFEGSNVILSAPAGSSLETETERGMFVRCVRSTIEQRDALFSNFSQFSASLLSLMQNKDFTNLERHDLATLKVDYAALAEHCGRILVLTNRDDAQFPQDSYAGMMQSVAENGIRWASPIRANGDKPASHNDDYHNPHRVAEPISEFLRHDPTTLPAQPAFSRSFARAA